MEEVVQIEDPVAIQTISNEMGESVSFETLKSFEDLKENAQFADLDKAIAYEQKHKIRKLTEEGTYEKYPVISTNSKTLGVYGVGLELYLTMLKQFAIVFFIISLISIWPMVENSNGAALKEGDQKNSYDSLTLANIGGFTYKYIPTDATAEELDHFFDDAESELHDSKDNQIRVATADFIYTFIFIIFIIYYRLVSKRVIQRNFKDNVTAKDYAVEVKGFPEEGINESEIKSHFEKYGTIVEVYIARKYEGLLGIYKERASLSLKEGYYRLLTTIDPKKAKKALKIQEKIKKFDEKNLKTPEGTFKSNDKLKVERVYIIFNEIISRQKCLKAYKTKVKYCRKIRQTSDLKFRGIHSLIVKPTVEPSHIKWENLEVTHLSRQIRRTIVISIAVCIMIASIVFIYIIKIESNIVPSDYECSKLADPSLDEEYAEVYYTTDDQIFCWCKGQTLSSVLSSHDYKVYCDHYLEKMALSTIVQVFGSIGIVFINWILEYTLQWLTKYERASTGTKVQLSTASKIFFAMLINTSFITVLVNANFQTLVFVKSLAFKDYLFNGDFDDFSREWFTKVGSTILITTLAGVVSPHFLNLTILYPISLIKRRYFRHRYKTQAQLNNLYAGPTFNLEIRISQTLTTIFTCFMYSGGIPLLNAVCFTTLFCVYWVDKFLILRYYRAPPLHSFELNKRVQNIIPYAIIIHCGLSLYMYGAEEIFPTGVHITSAGELWPDGQKMSERITRTSGILNIVLIGITALLVISHITVKKILNISSYTMRIRDEQESSEQGTFIDNYESIKQHGIPSYDMMQNPVYRPLLASLNIAAPDSVKKEND